MAIFPLVNIHHEDIRSFRFIPVGGNWKRGAYDKDYCVYLMMFMMVFHGVETIQDGVGIFDFDPLADEDFRKFLRACLCSTIVLSNLNVYRDEFLKQMVAFRGNRKQDVLDALIKQREELTQKYMNDPSKIEIVAKNSSASTSGKNPCCSPLVEGGIYK
ncbi:uncharacterized protein [Spinacia oleracea]|uniref:Uncharacterized protein isoform X1 n=1 Tax=Spinacia oleracea TaxID=3562 RepID=A0ABM3R9C7_SPIOL|nr:uncharacterized protein LOC130467666 isoform X1 [Spinacia oleracea]